jgi:hypothetical protein
LTGGAGALVLVLCGGAARCDGLQPSEQGGRWEIAVVTTGRCRTRGESPGRVVMVSGGDHPGTSFRHSRRVCLLPRAVRRALIAATPGPPLGVPPVQQSGMRQRVSDRGEAPLFNSALSVPRTL